MTRTPQMAEPPRSPAPSTTSNALGLPPRTIPARSTARSWPQQEHAITNGILESLLSAPEAEGSMYKSPRRAPEQDSSSRSLQSGQGVSVAVTARTDLVPPPLPPRMRRMLAAGIGRGGTRAKSWLQTGTHRLGTTVGSTQLFCVLLPDAADMIGAGDLDLPQPSGPFSLHEMARMIYSEEVTDSTPVWANSIESWQKCGDCVARFSWPAPEVDDRSPLAGGRVFDVAHVHERLSPLARAAHDIEDADSPMHAARKLIKFAEQLQEQPEQEPEPELEPEPEPGPTPPMDSTHLVELSAAPEDAGVEPAQVASVEGPDPASLSLSTSDHSSSGVARNHVTVEQAAAEGPGVGDAAAAKQVPDREPEPEPEPEPESP